jgi:hypothetical protein
MSVRTRERHDLRSFDGEFVVLFTEVMGYVVDVNRWRTLGVYWMCADQDVPH